MTNGGPCCACLSVSYSPEECDGGKLRERWTCNDCGTEYIKRAVHEYLLESKSAEGKRKTARIKLLEGAAQAVCDDASYDENRDVCDVSVPPMEHLQNVLDHNELFPVSPR